MLHRALGAFTVLALLLIHTPSVVAQPSRFTHPTDVGLALGGNVTSIPDPNFEQSLISAGIDTDGIVNGQVLTADIADETLLNLNDDNIGDLTGIEGFASLQHLHFGGNDLSSVDLSNNTNLRTIRSTFGNASLSTVSLGSHPSLIELTLNDTNVASIDVTGAPGLLLLDLIRSLDGPGPVTALDLGTNPDLEALYLSNNQIASIDLSGNTLVTDVWIDGNPVSTLDFGLHSQLVWLDASSCPNLASVNLANGNNAFLATVDLSDDPGLSCVAVDDPAAANADQGVYAGWVHDAGLVFQGSCQSTGIGPASWGSAAGYHLGRARPSPFAGATQITYDLPQRSHVTLTVFDVRGRRVRTLADAERPAGRHTVAWDGRDARGRPAPSGVYFYRMASGRFVGTGRVVVLE